MKAGKVSLVKVRVLGKLLKQMLAPDITAGGLLRILGEVDKVLQLEPAGQDDMTLAILRLLPESTTMVEDDLLPLLSRSGLPYEQAVLFVDRVADLFLSAVPAVKNLLRALHQGNEGEVRGCLEILNVFKTEIAEDVALENGGFQRHRVVRLVELAPEHGGQCFRPLAPVLALLTLEFLLAGGGPYYRPCGYCSELFFATRDDARFCSDTCRAKASLRDRGL